MKNEDRDLLEVYGVEDLIVKPYKSGKSLRQVAEQAGCCVETVRRKLKAQGVEMRPAYHHSSPKPKRADAELPSCGAPPKLLYYQSNCKNCGIALYSWKSEKRDKCGFCKGG